MKKSILIIVLFILGFLELQAQKEVSGTIIDDQGVPLPGASVVEEDTTNGVQSDFDGNYSINVAEGQILTFSYVGFKSQSVTVEEASTIDITLLPGASELDEVVVVGYGTQKSVNLTGSVETVKAEEITKQPVAQTSQALAGLVPGLTATQSSGQPGNDNATIRIRGIGTLGNGNKNNPLILVDGIPDDINGIDPSDIESISVLKDASAAAIYGSRASNGVILITTKRGKEGKISTTYNTYTGIQSIAQNLKFLDAVGFMEAFNSAEPESFDEDTINAYKSGVDVGTDARPDTDWVDLVFSQAGIQQYHNLAVRGGSEKVRIAATVSYLNQDGNIPGFNFKRYNGRFNTDLKLGKKIDLALDLNFRKENQQAPGDLQNITRQAYRLQPLFTAINDDGSIGSGFSGGNPIGILRSGSLDERITNYFRGLMEVTYRPFNNFSISATYAPQFIDRDRDDFDANFFYKETSTGTPTQSIGDNGLFKETFTSFQDNFNALANYSKDFGNHSVSALLGYEFLKLKSEIWSASRRRFILQEFRGLDNGDADTQLNSGGSTLNGLESVFGRINYSFKDKYLLEANVRRDASSRFGPSFRSATFPSFSLGWIVSEEGFLRENETVSFLKFRASWGQLGNQFIFDNDGNPVNFAYTSLFGLGNANPTIGGVPIVGGAQTVLSNPNLRWETGETQNFGVDAKFFKSRLFLTAEYYVRTTKDILLSVTVPPSIGFEAPVQNAGVVKNTGYDISLGWQDAIGDFRYGFNANYSDFVNEITDLGGLDELPPGNTINRVGESIGAIYGLKVEGLYQENDFQSDGLLNPGLPVPQFGAIQPGDIKYANLNNDDAINNDDRDIIGSNLSTKNWGFDVFAEYKGVDLSISFLGVGGRDVALQGDAGWAFFNAGKIQEWQADYWTPANTNAPYPRLTPGSSHHNWRTSETWLFDASYVRMRNVTLGYDLPYTILDKILASNARVYISGQNLLTWDNMPDGIDPLVPNFSSGAFYPVTKVYSLGLNVTF